MYIMTNLLFIVKQAPKEDEYEFVKYLHNMGVRRISHAWSCTYDNEGKNYCSHCGNQFEDTGFRFCPFCGSRFLASVSVEQNALGKLIAVAKLKYPMPIKYKGKRSARARYKARKGWLKIH